MMARTSRTAVLLLALLAGCVIHGVSATDACDGHRNKVEGVDTAETDSTFTSDDGLLVIEGCGNVVSNNTYGTDGQKLFVTGSDNVVEVRRGMRVRLLRASSECDSVVSVR